MKYGCIGEKLAHSFSKEIHNLIADYEYELKELSPSEVEGFISSRDYSAVNVTIPYKETVIPYLDEIDESASLIGAVNTVVNKDGRLFGFNTDFFGMRALLSYADISVMGKKVLILGTGGTSKTAYSVCKYLGAKEIVKASRSEDKGGILYTNVYKYHKDSEIIINTTPVGMYPNIFASPIDVKNFPMLSGVIDAVYNPIKTALVLEAEKAGVKAIGGLYMLVSQAVKASEHFLGTSYSDELIDTVYERVVNEKTNIVLAGMPSCGKTTVGKIIADILGREFIDTDSIISERFGDIKTIFEERGEAEFRRIESEVIREVSIRSGAVISTGGGSVLNAENVMSLRKNGRIFFIDRPLSMLTSTEDRPLCPTLECLEKLYLERINIYRTVADETVDGSWGAHITAKTVISLFFGE
jgi:shikimate dehydrogenase